MFDEKEYAFKEEISNLKTHLEAEKILKME